MRGVIVAIAPDGTYGQLAAEDGQRYSYWTKEVRNGPVQAGQAVEFQMWEGQPIDIFVAQAPPAPRAAPRPGAPRQVAPRGAASVAANPAAYRAAATAAFAEASASLPTSSNYWVNLFISPKGRISRKQFWLHGFLPIVVVNIVFRFIPVIGSIVSLALMWASICISFKRFHDLGYPGWWSLISWIPAFAGGVVFGVGFFSASFVGMAWLLAEILWGIAFLIWLAQLIFVYIRVGQEGPNQYGPDPLAV